MGSPKMEHLGITFNEDGDVVSIWAGSFRTEKALASYVKPFFSGEPEDDDRPISAIAEDIGLSYYDTDFLESHFDSSRPYPPEKMFQGFSYSTSYWKAATEAAQRLTSGPLDSLILLFGYDHARTPQREKQPGKIVFLGSFEYDPRADSL